MEITNNNPMISLLPFQEESGVSGSEHPSNQVTQSETQEGKDRNSEGFAGELNSAFVQSAYLPLPQRIAGDVPVSSRSYSQEKGNAAQVIRFPSIEKALNTKAQQAAHGSITGAFIAGPNQPWNPQWVMEGQVPLQEGPSLSTNSSSPGLRELTQLKEMISQQTGGDEKQIQELAQQALLRLQKGENSADQSWRGGAPLVALSGNEFLDTQQGVQGVQGVQGGQLYPHDQKVSDLLKSDTDPLNLSHLSEIAQKREVSSNSNQSEFQLIRGGLDPSMGSKTHRLSKGSDESFGFQELGTGVNIHQLMQPQGKVHQPIPPVIVGHVVPGSMTRERLTSETIQNMGQSIRQMSVIGNGQMNIRLNPGNLGELMIRVSTDGKRVGLHVQASDEGAKKILEESISSLKENLASQNLSLAKVSVSLQSDSNQSSLSQGHGFQNSMNQYAQGQSNHFNSQQRNGSETYQQAGENEVYRSSQSAPIAQRYRSQTSTQSGRLDITA